MRIYDLLEGTLEYDQICRLDTVYKQIASEQDEWKSSCSFTCPDGCGTCCEHFEPDVTEAEALYLAAWMLYNQEETAFAIVEGTFVPAREYEDGCILFDAHSPYHCTVYGGRCLICRIFGFTGDRGKDGNKRWKPCKFHPEPLPKPLERRQYTQDELVSLFGALPPAMGDLMSQAEAIMPGAQGSTEPLRIALKHAIEKLVMIAGFHNDNNNDNNNAA